MKKLILKILRGPISRIVQLLVLTLMVLYLFQQAISSFGNKLLILDETEVEGKLYTPSINAVNIVTYPADDILKKWKETALDLLKNNDVITKQQHSVASSSTSLIIFQHKNVDDGYKTKFPYSLKPSKLKVHKNHKIMENLQIGPNSSTPLKIVNVNQENKYFSDSLTSSNVMDSHYEHLAHKAKSQNISKFNKTKDPNNIEYLEKPHESGSDQQTKPVINNNKGASPTINEFPSLNEINESLRESTSLPFNGITCKERSATPRMEMRGANYWALYNYIPAEESFKCNETVTYTTHGELTFLHNLAPLLRRWKGPISIAVYTPGTDYSAALEAVFYYRQCDNSIDDIFDSKPKYNERMGNLSRASESTEIHSNEKKEDKRETKVEINDDELTGSELVRKYVTFHFYFPVGRHHPSQGIPLLTLENGLLQYQANCDKQPPNANHIEFHGSKYPTKPYTSYRSKNNLTYPVNVGRNIARQSVNSHFVFASDIELYPSPGLIPRFLKMISQQHAKTSSFDDVHNNKQNQTVIQPSKRIVYVNAIFELQDGSKLPKTKLGLVKLLKTNKAIPFHKWVCPVCHTIPHYERWQHTDLLTDEMKISFIGKRHPPHHHWEPIYIGTNEEPLYDERLSWEGRADKMTQGYAMCVLDYDFAILNNAFLIHRPGIKLAQQAKASRRPKHSRAQGSLINNIIMPELRQLYGTRKGCSR